MPNSSLISEFKPNWRGIRGVSVGMGRHAGHPRRKIICIEGIERRGGGGIGSYTHCTYALCYLKQ
jgi:hypothetical protein